MTKSSAISLLTASKTVQCFGIKSRRLCVMFSIDHYIFGSVLLLLLAHTGPLLASENDVDDTYRRVVLIGTNLKLPCSPPDAEDILEYFTWSKNGVLLPDRSSTVLQSRFIIQSDFSLLIERVAEDDEGSYSCRVQSHPPRTTSYSVQVEVPAAIDELLHHGSNSPHYQLQEGGDLDLNCMASGRPLPTVTWKYQGRVLSAEESIVDVYQKVSSVHRIVGARRLDAGSYICEADNGVDLPAMATFVVEISHAPEIVVEQSWVHTGLGSLTELACTVYAQPAAQVTWFRSVEGVGNGEGERKHLEVVPSNRVGTLTMSNGLKHVLRFKSVRDADLGIYTCRAGNPHGQAEAAIEMSGKAIAAVLWVSPPHQANKVAGSEQKDDDDTKNQHVGYRLTWDAISQSPIYEYRLWLRPRGQPEISWVNLIIPSNSSAVSSSSSLHSHGYDLADLATGIVYQVSVQSRNRFGWSAESNTVYLSGGEDPELTDYDNEEKTSSSSTSTSSSSTSTSSSSTSTSSSSTSSASVEQFSSTLPDTTISITSTASPSPSFTSSPSPTSSPNPSPTITPTIIISSSSSTFDDDESMIESTIEVTETEGTTEDNQSTLPALIIDPVSVDQHGTHEEIETSTMETSTDQPASQPTTEFELCLPGDPGCNNHLPSSHGPENLPSSIVIPGNSAISRSRSWVTNLSIVLYSLAAVVSVLLMF